MADKIRGGLNTPWAGGGVLCTGNEEEVPVTQKGKNTRQIPDEETRVDSISTEGFMKVNVSPNPASENIRLEIHSGSDGGELLLTDLMRNVKLRRAYTGSSTVQDINIRKYPTGLYILKVSSKETFRTVRIFKE